jgi:hypothetical protein
MVSSERLFPWRDEGLLLSPVTYLFWVLGDFRIEFLQKGNGSYGPEHMGKPNVEIRRRILVKIPFDRSPHLWET